MSVEVEVEVDMEGVVMSDGGAGGADGFYVGGMENVLQDFVESWGECQRNKERDPALLNASVINLCLCSLSHSNAIGSFNYHNRSQR